MSPYRRNVLVGVVVLGAMITLGWMLIQFGGRFMSPFSPESMPVRFVVDQATGISSGSAVLYRGVTVGRVDRVMRADDQLRVLIDASLDREPPLPGNVRGVIRSQGLVGGSALIVLELTDGTPEGTLQPDQTIAARFVGLDILPPEFAELAVELRQTARQFRESNVIDHLDEQVLKVGGLVDSIQRLVEDGKLHDDLKTSLANIRTTTERADKIATDLEQFAGDLNRLSGQTSQTIDQARATIGKTEEQVLSLSRQVSARLEQVSRVLDQFHEIARKLNKGQGTAGALMNDPRLYESLVETARELNAAVLDLRRLVRQWEEEGVSLKMK